MADYDVIVIGAGCGGLTVGALLAKQGRKVLIIEQSNQIGGLCSTFEKDGYKFDLGALFIEATELINWGFERLGTTFGDEVDLVALDPIYTVILKDGTKIRYPVSSQETAKAIAKISPGDANRWHTYAEDMQELMDAIFAGFFNSSVSNFGDVVKLFTKTPQLLKYGPLFFSSYQDVIKKYFKHEKIRESFACQSFYVGLPPELLPGYLGLIPWGEHTGFYYSKGGMIGIPNGLKRCGEKLGMKVKLNTLVHSVLIRDRRAIGVTLTDGTEITSDVVVSDINAKKLYLDLIGEEHLPWLTRVGVKSYEYSIAAPMLCLGIDYEPPLEGHHSLMPKPLGEMNSYWWNTYLKNRFPPEQTGFVVSWTSGTDPSLAPKGHHVLIITFAAGPYHLEGTTWDKEKKNVTEKIIHYLSQKYIPGLADHVKVAMLVTPADFERRFLSPEGAVYALRHDLPHSSVFMPAAKSKSIKGLYLVGASTHPGAGVPSVISSGMIASDLIEKYE